MSPLWIAFDYFSAQWNKQPLDISDEIPIAGQFVVITGASSGIGAAAALQFAKRGAKVLMPCRDLKKGREVVANIKSKVQDAELTLFSLDLEDLDSVRACAIEIRKFVRDISDGEGISILVNNAGFWDPNEPLTKTKQGFESHMGVNYLGPFFLTNLLLDLLQAKATATEPSRIVFTSSLVHQLADLDLDDVNCEQMGGHGFGIANIGPYANSKLANMYNAYSLAKRLRAQGAHAHVHTYALCPGYNRTDFTRNARGFLKACVPVGRLMALEPEQGAENILYCALSNKCVNESGLMYRCNRVWEGAMEAAVDDQAADRLWKLSEKLVGAWQSRSQA